MIISSLSNSFGIKIEGVDLRKLSKTEIQDLKIRLKEHGVIYLPNQSLSDKEIIDFSTEFGSGELGQSGAKINLTSKYNHINNMTNLYSHDQIPLGYGGSHTDFWHSDQAFRDNPATNALLYCLIPSEHGGATSFVSTKISNLKLRDSELKMLKRLMSVYQPADFHDNATFKEVFHNTVVKNIDGDDHSIYISENTIRLEDEEGKDFSYLIQPILEKILKTEDMYSHNWNIGDLILFDNLQLLHRREEYQGNRWLKAVKIHADKSLFVQI